MDDGASTARGLIKGLGAGALGLTLAVGPLLLRIMDRSTADQRQGNERRRISLDSLTAGYPDSGDDSVHGGRLAMPNEALLGIQEWLSGHTAEDDVMPEASTLRGALKEACLVALCTRQGKLLLLDSDQHRKSSQLCCVHLNSLAKPGAAAVLPTQSLFVLLAAVGCGEGAFTLTPISIEGYVLSAKGARSDQPVCLSKQKKACHEQAWKWTEKGLVNVKHTLTVLRVQLYPVRCSPMQSVAASQAETKQAFLTLANKVQVLTSELDAARREAAHRDDQLQALASHAQEQQQVRQVAADQQLSQLREQLSQLQDRYEAVCGDKAASVAREAAAQDQISDGFRQLDQLKSQLVVAREETAVQEQGRLQAEAASQQQAEQIVQLTKQLDAARAQGGDALHQVSKLERRLKLGFEQLEVDKQRSCFVAETCVETLKAELDQTHANLELVVEERTALQRQVQGLQDQVRLTTQALESSQRQMVATRQEIQRKQEALQAAYTVSNEHQAAAVAALEREVVLRQEMDALQVSLAAKSASVEALVQKCAMHAVALAGTDKLLRSMQSAQAFEFESSPLFQSVHQSLNPAASKQARVAMRQSGVYEKVVHRFQQLKQNSTRSSLSITPAPDADSSSTPVSDASPAHTSIHTPTGLLPALTHTAAEQAKPNSRLMRSDGGSGISWTPPCGAGNVQGTGAPTLDAAADTLDSGTGGSGTAGHRWQHRSSLQAGEDKAVVAGRAAVRLDAHVSGTAPHTRGSLVDLDLRGSTSLVSKGGGPGSVISGSSGTADDELTAEITAIELGRLPGCLEDMLERNMLEGASMELRASIAAHELTPGALRTSTCTSSRQSGQRISWQIRSGSFGQVLGYDGMSPGVWGAVSPALSKFPRLSAGVSKLIDTPLSLPRPASSRAAVGPSLPGCSPVTASSITAAAAVASKHLGGRDSDMLQAAAGESMGASMASPTLMVAGDRGAQLVVSSQAETRSSQGQGQSCSAPVSCAGGQQPAAAQQQHVRHITTAEAARSPARGSAGAEQGCLSTGAHGTASADEAGSECAMSSPGSGAGQEERVHAHPLDEPVLHDDEIDDDDDDQQVCSDDPSGSSHAGGGDAADSHAGSTDDPSSAGGLRDGTHTARGSEGGSSTEQEEDTVQEFKSLETPRTGGRAVLLTPLNLLRANSRHGQVVLRHSRSSSEEEPELGDTTTRRRRKHMRTPRIIQSGPTPRIMNRRNREEDSTVMKPASAQ